MEHLTCKSSTDNLSLSVAISTPEGTPKGVFQIVHGMCEHKERYYDFMEFLASNGYVTIIHDQRGHGASVKSGNDLGYFYSGGWKGLVDDIKVVGDTARERWPGLPFTLLGHSMGSLAVRSYVKRYDDTIDRLFVCGCPSDNPAKGAGAALAWCIGALRGWHFRPMILQKLSFGGYNKPFEGEGYSRAWVCSNHDILEKYHKDPLCRFVFTANGFYNLLKMMQDCYSKKGWKPRRPGLPIRFISGGDDPCRISDEALQDAARHMRRSGYRDVSVKIYKGMRHEILNETDRQTVWNDVLTMTKGGRV